MMGNSRFERLAPLSGAVSVVLIIVASVLVNIYSYLPPADEIVQALTDNVMRVSIGGYVGGLAAFFLMWFAGSVYSALREREGGAGRLSALALGGGMASGTLAAISFGLMIVAAQRAGTTDGISAAGAITLYDFWGQVMGGTFPLALAVLVVATGIAAIRTGAFPAWFGWISVVIAVGLLSPVSWVVMALGALWLLVVSIWLTVRGAPQSAASTMREAGMETA